MGIPYLLCQIDNLNSRMNYITINTGDNLEKICYSIPYDSIRYSLINNLNIPSDLPSDCSSIYGVIYLFNLARFTILFLNVDGQLFSKMASGEVTEFNPWRKISMN